MLSKSSASRLSSSTALVAKKEVGGLPWGRLLGVLLIAGLAASCAKEDKDIEIANQETKIDNYINNLGDAYEVVRKDGSNRVIVTAGTGSQTLEEGDSLYYYYSGYIFSGNGKGAIFVTNRKEDAEQFFSGVPRCKNIEVP